MKRFYLITLLFLIGISCKHTATTDPEITPKALVKITTISHKDMKEQATLFATSSYLKKYAINAPLTGFITKVNVRLGQRVNKGDMLYEVETKERSALNSRGLLNEDTSLLKYGRINIKASSNGIVSALDKQQVGDYVQEGNSLCTIAESRSLVFLLNVPYEYVGYLKQNKYCDIILPNRTKIKGEITAPLTTMNAAAQTQSYLVRPQKEIFLPEGLVSSVLLTTHAKPDAQVLPKASVLSDEVMKNFWVMKLINDSIAIKVPVDIGISDDEQIEIDSPQFNESDKILVKGNYGLSDTALVKITQ